MMKIINRHHCCLSFIGMTKAKNKRHEDNCFRCRLLCLRRTRTRGREEDDEGIKKKDI
jgi:hypothetical protein